MDGRSVNVGWFTEQDADKLILFSFTVGRWDLLVIPPETEPAAAARLMAAAAILGSVLKAGVLMANEAAIERGMRDSRDWEDTWDRVAWRRRRPPPNVVRVTDRTAVGDALDRLGVVPDVRHATASTLLNAHRVTRDATSTTSATASTRRPSNRPSPRSTTR